MKNVLFRDLHTSLLSENTICMFFVSNTFYWNQTNSGVMGTSVVKLTWFKQYFSQRDSAMNSLQASTRVTKMTKAFFSVIMSPHSGLLPPRGWYSSMRLGWLGKWEVQLVVLTCVDSILCDLFHISSGLRKDYVPSFLVHVRWHEIYCWLYCTVSMDYRSTIWLLKVEVMYQLALEKLYTCLKISKGDIKPKASKECFYIAMWSIMIYLPD